MLGRGGWALTMVAAASVGLLAPEIPTVTTDLRGSDLAAALVALGSLVQLVLSSWVLLTVALVVVHAPAPIVRAVAPRLLRRALFAGAAGALALSPVHADPLAAPGHAERHDLEGLRLPDRPVAAMPPAAATRRSVVVRPGDTLWAIAARSLPTGASDAEVARAVGQWHQANRDVIGADPDLIFPDQRLNQPLEKDPT